MTRSVSDPGAASERGIRYGFVPANDLACLTLAMHPAITDPSLRHRSGKDGSMMGLNLKICGDRGNRLNFTVTSNTASQPVVGPIMRFDDVQGVTVTGNSQPLSKGELATFTGSTNVTYRRLIGRGMLTVVRRMRRAPLSMPTRRPRTIRPASRQSGRTMT